MSRHDWDDIWQQHLGDGQVANCPCCNITVIHRGSKNAGRRNWDRGHIIPHDAEGPDILENVRPICTTCNQKDKTYASNYHYMALVLGRMTIAEADAGVTAIWEIHDRHRNNISMKKCLAIVESTQEPCPKSRKPHSYFCKVHGTNPAKHFDYQYQKYLGVTLKQLRQDYRQAALDNDMERFVIIAEIIQELLAIG